MINDILSSLGKAENSMLEMEFISPIFYTTTVATKVAGVVHTLAINKAEPGWYRIKPTDFRNAEIRGPAELFDVGEYLSRLPKIRVTVIMQKGKTFLGAVEKDSIAGVNTTHILLPSDILQEFDRVICRYDGANFWFDDIEAVNDPSKGEYLREALVKMIDPKALKFSGLLFDEKAAYALRLVFDKEIVQERKKSSLESDVKHAGGEFKSFSEKAKHYEVKYTVDGDSYVSLVSKDPVHQVISAGICLSDEDEKYDLKSLVTVLREGAHRDLIHRTRG